MVDLGVLVATIFSLPIKLARSLSKQLSILTPLETQFEKATMTTSLNHTANTNSNHSVYNSDKKSNKNYTKA